jgi:hypothetical protein
MATVSSGMPVGRVAWEKSERPMTGPLKTSVHPPTTPYTVRPCLGWTSSASGWSTNHRTK